MPARKISKPDFRHSLGITPIVCEASSAGASMFDRGASFRVMNLGPAGRQLLFSTSHSQFLEKQLLDSPYPLAEILNVSHTTILNHLRDAPGMKFFHLRRIPQQLTKQL
jgi:hypothetical protein